MSIRPDIEEDIRREEHKKESKIMYTGISRKMLKKEFQERANERKRRERIYGVKAYQEKLNNQIEYH